MPVDLEILTGPREKACSMVFEALARKKLVPGVTWRWDWSHLRHFSSHRVVDVGCHLSLCVNSLCGLGFHLRVIRRSSEWSELWSEFPTSKRRLHHFLWPNLEGFPCSRREVIASSDCYAIGYKWLPKVGPDLRGSYTRPHLSMGENSWGVSRAQGWPVLGDSSRHNR